MEGEEVVIVSDDGTEHVFPAGFDPKKAAAIVSGASTPPESKTGSVVRAMKSAVGDGALPLAATAGAYATPILRHAVEEFATNPNVPRMGSQIGRVIGGLAPPIGGAIEGGPVGALAGIAAAAKGAWAGGKTGWFTAKLAQQIGMPVSKILAAAEEIGQGRLGQMVGAMSAESAVLDKLNSPESFAKFADAMKPDEREKFAQFIERTTGKVPDWKPNAKDTRSDGSQKGTGYLGVLPRKDGGVSTEISIGVNLDGKEVEIPTLVPTLTAQEQDWLLSNDVSNPRNIPKPIIDKAVAYARQRIASGKSPFAESK